MTQKDKVKELVGRGLNSYHTKSLQQIDRIEKKNKEQNHKISILTNELDNEYLTKTEEGSVVSLEHSKEGMVYIDSLEGNTLVNYCTDGSKEMTLNGDIDVEGTFVTTTEGVDNGLVDVMCEGNTLINIFSTNNYSHTTHAEIRNNITHNITKNSIEVTFNKDCIGSEYMILLIGDVNTKHISMLKPNQKYTLCFDVEQNYDWTLDINCKKGNSADPLFIANRVKIKNGRNKITMTTLATLPTLTDQRMYLDIADKIQRLAGRYLKISNLVLVENEEDDIVPYFEGMKSVGQDDENGHKIEILSKNKNLFNPEEVYESGYSYGVPFVDSVKCQEEDGVFTIVTPENSWNRGIGFHIKTEKNKDYTLSVGEYFNDGVNMELRCVGVYKSEYPLKNNNNIQSYVDRIVAKELDSNNNSLTYNSKDYDYILFYIGGKWAQNANGVKTFRMSKIEVNQSSTKPTNYTKQNLNKKEILLNEPLRGLPNGIKDRFVKIGGKWFIERNTKKVIIDNNTLLQNSGLEGQEICKKFMVGAEVFSDRYVCNEFDSFVVCDTLPTLIQSERTKDVEFVSPDGWNINIFFSIKRSKLQGDTIEDIKTYLQQNPMELIYRLTTPIYEPLEIESTLSCYTDVTHISNNSIIPCNMKMKNSGYNAIIKPSTLYTVALDTNKSGTVGMNLGGAKVTTKNNVATITTPATLADDSLRLYGKSIKGSKVRILEGDKTNWIPSFFEGMQSSFEDKVQEDGSYKMEISSNNKNLFNENILEKVNSNYYEIINKDNRRCLKIERPSLMYRTRILNQLKKNTSYKISFDMLYDRIKGNGMAQGASIHIVYTDGTSNSCYARNSYNEWLNASIITPSNKTIHYIQFSYGTNTPTYIDLDTFIIQENNNLVDYVYHKSNKIQFSSIEPLRSVNLVNRYIKDRFVFKDDKLVIERNCKKIVLDGTQSFSKNADQSKDGTSLFGTGDLTPERPSYHVECDSFGSSGSNLMTNTTFANVEGIGCWSAKKNFNIRIKTCRLKEDSNNGMMEYVRENPITIIYPTSEPTYEEIPFELQKIILEGYENGTLFFDTNIPPTSTVTYAGETPIVKSVRLNKTEVLNNTNDINDNIVPYLMDMDYRVVCLQLQSENINDGVSMARLFGGTYEMLQRDILSKRYSVEEYKYRLDAYLSANKITNEEYEKLGDMLNE